MESITQLGAPKTPPFAILLVGVLGLTGQVAQAQTPESANPEALFREGMELRKEGDFVGACAKFLASMNLVPTVATALKVAECNLRENKLVAALSAYRRARDINASDREEARKIERGAVVAARINELESRVPKLRITAERWPTKLHVTRNGQAISMTELGTDVEVDPGAYEIVAEAQGYRRAEARVEIAEREHKEVPIAWIPALLLPTGTSPSLLTASSPISTNAPPSPMGAQRTAAITLGALGVAAAGVGIGFLGDMQSKLEASRQYCHPTSSFTVCYKGTIGKTLLADALISQNVGLVLAIAGGAAALAGISLFVVTPSGTGVPPSQGSQRALVVAAAPGQASIAAYW